MPCVHLKRRPRKTRRPLPALPPRQHRLLRPPHLLTTHLPIPLANPVPPSPQTPIQAVSLRRVYSWDGADRGCLSGLPRRALRIEPYGDKREEAGWEVGGGETEVWWEVGRGAGEDGGFYAE